MDRNTENKGRGGLGDSHMVVTRTDANESCVCVCVCVCVCENDVRK